MATAAQVIADRLYEAGCRHAFGIPGGEVLTLINTLEETGIKFYLAKHENAAGFMAEGTHHFTQTPCILIATIGPGVANAVNFVTNCFQDQVPLIFLTGCIDRVISQTYTHQIFDHGKLLSSITKKSFKAEDGIIDIIVDKALSIATDNRPGPVHIDLPMSLANREQNKFVKTRRVSPGLVGPVDSEKLMDARRVFSNASKPLLIAGLDIMHEDSGPKLLKIVKKFKLPTITTYKAKGVVPEDHPCSLGAAGLSPKADKILHPLIQKSDLIILAGYNPIEMRSSWSSLWDQRKDVIEFSLTENTHYVYQAKYSFIGNISAGLCALTHKVNPKPIWVDGLQTKTRKSHKAAFLFEKKWGPASIIRAARKVFPRNGVATVDTGAHRIFLSQAWECYSSRGLLQSSGLCTMGVALPLAIGRKLVDPTCPVMVFTGDAGLEMVLGELATLRDLKLAIPIIVFVDKQLSLIEMKQRESQLGSVGVEFGATDFSATANALGGFGVLAESEEEVETQLSHALKRDCFTIISCPINKNAYDENI